MTVPALSAPAATGPHPRRYVAASELTHRRPIAPVDPARVSPLHLPAVAHVASDLDGVDVPVRVVAPTELGGCEDCHDEYRGETALDAIATVHALSAYGRTITVEVCALHLPVAVRWFTRQEMRVHVTAPASGGRRWFERSQRETFFAVDDEHGVVVARDVLDTWTVYLHVENHAPVVLAARMGIYGPQTARQRAEDIGQAVASQLASDAALVADEMVEVAA